MGDYIHMYGVGPHSKSYHRKRKEEKKAHTHTPNPPLPMQDRDECSFPQPPFPGLKKSPK